MIDSAEYRRDTRAPLMPPPAGACDCHVHIFDMTKAYRLRAERTYEPPSASVQDLLKMHRTLGIERGVIVQPTAYGSDHRAMLDALAQLGSGYRGVAIVNDDVTDADLLRLHHAGTRAARFSFAKFLRIAPTPEQFVRGVARVRELGWHIKIFSAGDDLLDIADLVRNVDIPIVFDHMGFFNVADGLQQPGFALLLRFLLERENCWVMISNGDRRSASAGYPWRDVVPYAQACISAAPNRVIWSTDWPHLAYEKEMLDDSYLLNFLYLCTPDTNVREKILVTNPATLYGFQ